MPRIKKTKLEELNELACRYAVVLSYAEEQQIVVHMERGRNPGLLAAPASDPSDIYSSCTVGHAEKTVANPATASHVAWDAESENVLRIRFDQDPVVVALREQERGGLHFDWINPRDIETMLEAAWQRWVMNWQRNRPHIDAHRARIDILPDHTVVATEIPLEHPYRQPITPDRVIRQYFPPVREEQAA